MDGYFDREQGIGYRMGTDVKPVLQTVATRFCADNPPVPALYYLRSKKGFSISEDYLDEIKLHEKFPEMEPESYVYAWAQMMPAAAGPFHFRFSAYGPVTVYVNGEPVYRTNHTQERFSHEISDICLELRDGKNELLFECISTPLGCGFRIGSSSYKGRRIQFFAPDDGHDGMSGFVYTKPRRHPLEHVSEAGMLDWYPEADWEESRKHCPVSERLFKGRRMLSVTRVFCLTGGTYRICGTVEKQTVFYLDGEKAAQFDKTVDAAFEWEGGSHLLAFLGGGVEVRILDEAGNEISKTSPVLFAGKRELKWLYAGPFEDRETPDLAGMLTFRKPFLAGGKKTFWQVDLPDMYLRPFNEGALYGEWNYPLGVTLYGLLQSARVLKDHALDGYVEGHMQKCTDFYEYCMWDKETWGAAPFHNQLTTVDSLDDCGSFASALLETMKDHEIPAGQTVADRVADYMQKQQQRLADGTFYRNHSYLPIMNETMWADDLYMSIPFLSRYYERSGESIYLEDAIRQMKQVFHYLFMPEQKILSHIYDTHYQVQTKVPWGRGNGWALFSATELLAVMPGQHPERPAVLEIFRDLCEGYLRLQDEDGMWHQVLTMPDSYQETSCTAMFIYGFARGVRYGWLEGPAAYAAAAWKGWTALCGRAVDWKGNIYGVCRGSGYSFSKEYYANELGWNFNDTHGTGIVLLAGIEVELMQERGRK